MVPASRLAKNDRAMLEMYAVRTACVPHRAPALRMKTAQVFRIAKTATVWSRGAVKPLWIAWAIEFAQQDFAKPPVVKQAVGKMKSAATTDCALMHRCQNVTQIKTVLVNKYAMGVNAQRRRGAPVTQR